MLFFLAAIVYVDDTDLLLRIRRLSDTEKDFARQIQQALWDWGMIVMTTGGYLKQKKCYVSLSFFHFKNDKACLKKKGQLNTTHMVVPQPKGPDLPIPIIGPEESRETLGVLTNGAGTSDDHLAEIMWKGKEWGEKLKSHGYIKAQDGWLSFQIQLKPT